MYNARGYSLNLHPHIYKQNERHIVFIHPLEIGDFGN